jgi:c-di-GMP-related signal transduction protein
MAQEYQEAVNYIDFLSIEILSKGIKLLWHCIGIKKIIFSNKYFFVYYIPVTIVYKKGVHIKFFLLIRYYVKPNIIMKANNCIVIVESIRREMNVMIKEASIKRMTAIFL